MLMSALCSISQWGKVRQEGKDLAEVFCLQQGSHPSGTGPLPGDRQAGGASIIAPHYRRRAGVAVEVYEGLCVRLYWAQCTQQGTKPKAAGIPDGRRGTESACGQDQHIPRETVHGNPCTSWGIL